MSRIRPTLLTYIDAGSGAISAIDAWTVHSIKIRIRYPNVGLILAYIDNCVLEIVQCRPQKCTDNKLFSRQP